MLREIPGVHGVGEGIGNPAWIAYVQDATVAELLPKRVGGRDVVPLITGEITTRPANSRLVPAAKLPPAGFWLKAKRPVRVPGPFSLMTLATASNLGAFAYGAAE